MSEILFAITLSERHALTLYIFLAVAALAGAWTLLQIYERNHP